MTVRLAGRLLVASPGLGDPNFVRTVVLLVEHGPEGALGLVLNRPTEVEVGSVLPEWADSATDPTVLFQGGPVGLDGVLALGLLSTVEPTGGGPVGWRPLDSALGLVDLDEPSVQPFLGGLRLFAGYAGWGADQLEAELAEGAWYVVDAWHADVLTARPERLWRSVLRRQGGDLAMVSSWTDDPSRN
jgi:putative transcriptional regulator